ncbi:MAG TPA: protein-methionine-sulfoxide reductase catalytic subunit MsrP [Methylocella sp.]|nr:protein-methionine-sulfoxide reductase catalytic subunit MsrP [Methylocella sp.]
MLIRRRKGWEIAEREATPEHLFFKRREILKAAATVAATTAFAPGSLAEEIKAPLQPLYPAKRNETFVLDREVTPERINAHYNNFYEFGMTKDIAAAAEALKTRPWTLKIDGLVENPKEIGIDDLISAIPLEERLYRHRCVEGWAMAVPWTGFPLATLLGRAKPLASARYVRMETFLDRITAPGQRQFWYPWPYVEGLTIEEASNDLAFLVTGAYGKPLGKSFGAPLRLAVPWKYGFKSIKSITRVSLVADRPKSFWEQLQSSEYGFWANVNPAVPHPRWSQATEEVLGTSQRRPTLIFNGYGEFVANLYSGMDSEALYM